MNFSTNLIIGDCKGQYLIVWLLFFFQGFFGEEEDSETSMYFPGSSNLFRPDKDVSIVSHCSYTYEPCSSKRGLNASQWYKVQRRSSSNYGSIKILFVK